MNRYVLIFLVVYLPCEVSAQVDNPVDIVGVWKSPDNDFMIKIDKIGSTFQGRIVWVKQEEHARLTLDVNNPNEKLRRMPLKGNKIIQDLSFNSKTAQWEGGTFYNHEEGKQYRCRISLQEADHLTIAKYQQDSKKAVVEIWTRH